MIKFINSGIRYIFLLVFLMYSYTTLAAYKEQIGKNMSPQTQWTFNRAGACLNEDMFNRIEANGECLAIQTYLGKHIPNKNPALLVFIHGDGIPGGGPSDYLKYQATKFISGDVVPVVIIRPGYYDSYNNYSTGESYAFSCNGYPCDSYRTHTVDTIAYAIKRLKNFYNASRVILVGHSGGAIMSSIILGRYPHLVDGAILASTTYNVHIWADKHQWGSYTNSLSPDEYVNKIDKNSFVYIISGEKDTNTYPDMAKKYSDELIKQGIKSKFFSVKGGTHNSIVLSDTDLLDQVIQLTIDEFSTKNKTSGKSDARELPNLIKK
jgi:predicted esterase